MCAIEAEGFFAMTSRQSVSWFANVSAWRQVRSASTPQTAAHAPSLSCVPRTPYRAAQLVASATPRAINPMLARYWKWSATNEKRMGWTSMNPRAGARVVTKTNTAASGPRPIRARVVHSAAPAASAESGKRYCHALLASTRQRG